MEKAIKIQKSKNIRLQLTGLISFAILFSVCLCYFLGWKFELKTFFIAVAILIALLLIPWVICLFLIKFERQYYLIEKEQITLWKNDNLLCELKKSDFVEIEYQRFVWAFLMQMGSGYLNITCPVEALSDKKYASVVMPNGMAVFEISMSTRQAKEVAKILSRNITIK